MNTGTDVCGGRESRSRLTEMASCNRAVAGSIMKQTMAIAVRVTTRRGLFASYAIAQRSSHLFLPEVSHALARKVLVRSADRNSEVALEVDGQLPRKLPATFQIIAKALRVRVNC